MCIQTEITGEIGRTIEQERERKSERVSIATLLGCVWCYCMAYIGVDIICEAMTTRLPIHMRKKVPTWTRIVAAVLPTTVIAHAATASVLGRSTIPGTHLASAPA